MYYQSFRKGSFFWGHLPGKRGLVFWGEKESALFTWNLVGESQDYNIYRPITIHPTIMYHQAFRKGSFFWCHLPGKRGLVFLGEKESTLFTWNLVGQSLDYYNIYRPISIHPTIMYHQSFRKGSFFWGHLPGKRGLFFLGEKVSALFSWNLVGLSQDYNVYRLINIQTFMKEPFCFLLWYSMRTKSKCSVLA